MKLLSALSLILLTVSLSAQSPGDTIVVESFNYTQTHGKPWDGTIRDTMIDFPDNPDMTYEKIIMLYNMRCKDGLVSNTNDRDKGCGEWDYSCNTYITDSSRVDSVLSFTSSHYISAFNGSQFYYVQSPLFDFYQYRQKQVVINTTNSETISTVGSGSSSLSHVLATDNNSGRSQYLYLQSDLTAAGVVSGDVDGITITVTGNTSDADYLRVRIKQTDKTALLASEPDLDGFTEVYFHDMTLSPGLNRIQFYTPFSWDGTSNLIVEFSFTNHENSTGLTVDGESTAYTSGLYADNGYNLNAVNGKSDIPAAPLSSVSSELTISFWSYGNEEVQPISNSIFHGVDNDNNRQVNLHLPWGNSNIYFDCGNDGTGYDRINKAATPDEFKGSWSHWAVTKNTDSGTMKIYHNGELWHSGTGKTRLIDIQQFILGTSGTADRSYYGKIDEFRVWDKELSNDEIRDWMHQPLNTSHPEYSHLVAYYPIDEGSGTTINDLSTNGESAEIEGYMYWLSDRGADLNRGFVASSERPNVGFIQGDYDLTISDEIVTDSVSRTPNIVREYEIIPRYGTHLSDSINEVSVNEFWEAGYQHLYDPEGVLIDSVEVAPTDTIEVTELTYFRRFPAKYEIMSFVTPYGIYLDLGMEGKTWAYDVSDYGPILKGKKRMTVERGGQWQEDMDIKFLFIVGTPTREVLDINQLWRPDSKSYTDIIADRAFEPRDLLINPNGEQFKIRSVISGHGQQGEFTPRHHFLKIDGNEEFNWTVWTECADNPIYPQGGTWVYDRAGWCPGKSTHLFEYDITDYVTPGQTTNIDYGLEYANGTSNYIVNNQLVTYGEPNFSLDAAVIAVIKPNDQDARNERFNPACTFPEIIIRNNGTTTLTSLDITYSEEGGEEVTVPWSGSLEFLEVDTVALPISDISFWLPTSNIFLVEVGNPNGQDDEYEYNNSFRTHFDGVDVFPEGQIINIVCKTNNYGWQTSYTLYDGQGNVFLEWDNLDDNTVYETPLILSTGCYKLQINDRGGDGLEWWANPAQGNGYMKLKDNDGNTLYNFETDFGNFEIYEFGIGEITTVKPAGEELAVSAYPNPASEFLNILITGNTGKAPHVSMFNSLGSQVLNSEFSADGKEVREQLDISNLKPGIYVLKIETGKQTVAKKIVVR